MGRWRLTLSTLHHGQPRAFHKRDVQSSGGQEEAVFGSQGGNSDLSRSSASSFVSQNKKKANLVATKDVVAHRRSILVLCQINNMSEQLLTFFVLFWMTTAFRGRPLKPKKIGQNKR